MSWEDATNRLKERARGFALTDAMAQLAIRACQASEYYRQYGGGDPGVCTGDSEPVIYYGATWTDSGGVKPIEATTLHIAASLTMEPSWAELHYVPSKPGDHSWYRTMGICSPSSDPNNLTTCDEYPFFSTREGGPSAHPQPSVIEVPRNETQPQGTSMSSFYYWVQSESKPYQSPADKYSFGVIPMVLGDMVLPVPTFWV